MYDLPTILENSGTRSSIMVDLIKNETGRLHLSCFANKVISYTVECHFLLLTENNSTQIKRKYLIVGLDML